MQRLPDKIGCIRGIPWTGVFRPRKCGESACPRKRSACGGCAAMRASGARKTFFCRRRMSLHPRQFPRVLLTPSRPVTPLSQARDAAFQKGSTILCLPWVRPKTSGFAHVAGTLTAFCPPRQAARAAREDSGGLDVGPLSLDDDPAASSAEVELPPYTLSPKP